MEGIFDRGEGKGTIFDYEGGGESHTTRKKPHNNNEGGKKGGGEEKKGGRQWYTTRKPTHKIQRKGGRGARLILKAKTGKKGECCKEKKRQRDHSNGRATRKTRKTVMFPREKKSGVRYPPMLGTAKKKK